MVAIISQSAAFTPSPVTTARAARAARSKQEALYDRTLVRRFNGGDHAAFDEIISRYRSRVLSIAVAQLRNHADAEEIVQDTFIRAYRGLTTFRGESSLFTWLHRITLNLARNRYWYFFRRCRHSTQSMDRPLTSESAATLADVVPSEAPGPVRESAMREFSHLVAECMEKLDPPQREILNQRSAMNCSYDEISTALGINVGTVKSRIARARGSLRVLLAKACPGMPPDAFPRDWFDPIRTWGHS